MNRQLSLLPADDQPTRMPTDRLFFAIFPDAQAATCIARLAQRLRSERGLRGRPLATDRFHITLHHLGDFVGLPKDLIVLAGKAAKNVQAPPFDVTFDRAMSFSGRVSSRPFVLSGGEGVAALVAFQRDLGLSMCKAGLRKQVERRFTPHVTLLYDDRMVAAQALSPVSWIAREFVLVHSLLGRTQHVPLERWALNG